MNESSVILERIQRARRELLDLSSRNRLISTPRQTALGRKIEVVDERTDEVFRLLVSERKAMSFLPGSGGDDVSTVDSVFLSQPEEVSSPEGSPDPRHTDLRLQTRLSSEVLQGRLLKMFYDAQTYEQEQGVSILYLAAGFLRWYESSSSDKARYAPLLLIPVDLERTSAAKRFHIRYREEDIATNLSLQSKLRAEFGVEIPDIPEPEDLSPSAYLDAVHEAVASQPRWEVLRNDMVLWFFSFAKYLMYRDLDPGSWPAHSQLSTNPTLSGLLGEGFPTEAPLIGDNEKIDPLIPPEAMVHVTDADSSQAVVIEEVRRGKHLVVQGPPGTGKSQTITNLIAGAVREGKKVLFVAEKMAALEVVHGRLESLGLGPLCLELHSRKANKKAVLAELSRTLALGRPKVGKPREPMESLRGAIARLNQHADLMNTPIQPAGVTPFQIVGRLTALYGRGMEPNELALMDSETWTPASFRERLLGIEDIQAYLNDLGPPLDHPWRGVTRTEPILPADLKALLAGITDAAGSLEATLDAAVRLAGTMGVVLPEFPSQRDVQGLVQFAVRIVNAPPMDRRQIAHEVWATRREAIEGLVTKGSETATRRDELASTVTKAAWQSDLLTTRRILASHGRSLFRWFRKDYRGAVATLRGLLKGEPPGTLVERLRLVDGVIAVETASASLDEDTANTQLGRDAFGIEWKGSSSNWTALAEIIKWDVASRDARLAWDHRAVLSRLDQTDSCNQQLRILRDRLKTTANCFLVLSRTLALDPVEAFGGSPLLLTPIHKIFECLRRWRENPESVSKWIGYLARRQRLESVGLAAVVEGLHEGRISAEKAVDSFLVAYYQALIRGVFRRHKELAEFDGRSYERWIEEFRGLDLARIEMARGEVALAHHDAIPRGTGGEMAVIRREIEKKRKHKPIRQLLREAGTAVLSIKPVFMMSPISVAQFLEPGTVTFDLMIIDEASQVSPVDAFGAVARARQLVVVGDDKQLPPSRFFSKMLDEDAPAESDEEGLDVGDLESVLGLCVAQGLPQRMLRWHYRSRHHSLIAVSNREFYDNNLNVIPSPAAITATSGLHFRHIGDGLFDRGKTATNRVEARAIAEAVLEQAQRYPNKSLGVGAFSVTQRDAIRDELEVLQRQHVELAAFFAPGRTEPFFIKNLENIQGDERDVIFISVGYARDSSGSLAMNFGPLSSEGGERRLNVLISRARERCEVFSSITADDIDLKRAKSRGAAALKTFLQYAATGILDPQASTGEAFDSDFERQVASALRSRGHEVELQVGTAGFLIDLAVVDANQPGRYVLGIECDGATYHSARSARDRDRLRDTVLRERGWKIHHVWSTDWFHRPVEQLNKVADAIEHARREQSVDQEATAELVTTSAAVQPPEDPIERSESVSENGISSFPWVIPYIEAVIDVPNGTPIHETADHILVDIVTKVVEIEGPIHRDEIARRLTSLWGQSRIGGRIAESTSHAIDAAVLSGTLRCDAEFVSHCLRDHIQVRSRSEVASTGLRKPEMLPPAEIREAIIRLVSEDVGIHRQDIPAIVARVLGFKAAGMKMKETIDGVAVRMVELGTIVARDEKLFLK